MKRNWRGDSVTERGSMPAKKELQDVKLSELRYGWNKRPEGHLRNCHDSAQSEQHEKTVPHDELQRRGDGEEGKKNSRVPNIQETCKTPHTH